MRAGGWGLGLIFCLSADAALGGDLPLRAEAAPEGAAGV